jgi:hypothetical protein
VTTAPALFIDWIPLAQIEFASGNPRSDAAEDLDGMAASLGSEDQPVLVNPPVVLALAEGRFKVVAGERRVRAAHLAGWQKVLCQVRHDLDAHQAHRMRVVENLHRRELNALDQAAALKITWLCANADALGLHSEVEQVLAHERTQPETIAALEKLLAEAEFTPSRPLVTWDAVLDGLGVEMKPDRRKKLMRVLSLDEQAQATVRNLGLTEAALRSIGTLEPQEQRQLAEELEEDPSLARKVRRIARVVRNGSHTFDEALAEARGKVSTSDEDGEDQPADAPVAYIPDDEQVTDQVIRLLEAATNARQAVDELKALVGEDFMAQLPDAWREYAREALHIIHSLEENNV